VIDHMVAPDRDFDFDFDFDFESRVDRR